MAKGITSSLILGQRIKVEMNEIRAIFKVLKNRLDDIEMLLQCNQPGNR